MIDLVKNNKYKDYEITVHVISNQETNDTFMVEQIYYKGNLLNERKVSYELYNFDRCESEVIIKTHIRDIKLKELGL